VSDFDFSLIHKTLKIPEDLFKRWVEENQNTTNFGHFVKTLFYRSVLAAKKRCAFCEKDCREENYEVQDTLWEDSLLRMKGEYCCFDCLEEKLWDSGIRLKVSHFTKHPSNNMIFRGFALCAASPLSIN